MHIGVRDAGNIMMIGVDDDGMIIMTIITSAQRHAAASASHPTFTSNTEAPTQHTPGEHLSVQHKLPDAHVQDVGALWHHRTRRQPRASKMRSTRQGTWRKCQ